MRGNLKNCPFFVTNREIIRNFWGKYLQIIIEIANFAIRKNKIEHIDIKIFFCFVLVD